MRCPPATTSFPPSKSSNSVLLPTFTNCAMAVLLREKFWLLTWKSIAQNVTPKPLDSLEEQNSKRQWQSKICLGRFLARRKGESALKRQRKRPTCSACGLILGSSPLAAD